MLAAVVAALVAVGLLTDDDDGGDQTRAAASHRDAATAAAARTESRRRRGGSACGSRPITPTYVCIDRGAGTPVVFEGILEAPQIFSGRRLRVNLGKTDVELRVNGRPLPVEPGPEPDRVRVHADDPEAAALGRAALRYEAGLSARAGIVVTGTEVLTGRVRDRNGPWLSDRLLELGVELAHITICGDRPQDIEAQLDFMADQGVDLIVTSGGLGPTADDMTVEVVARFSGRELLLDEALEDRIAEILRPLMRRFRYWDPEAMRAANRKQALVPEGAVVIDPVGTAPGVVVPGRPAIVVLPGPPRELQPMWEVAVASDAVQAAIAGRTHYLQHTLRLFGLPESALAETLREAETQIEDFDRLEITTCLRRGELEMVTRCRAGRDRARTRRWRRFVRERHPRELYSTDGARVDDLVAELLAGRCIATAESCTAGLLAARLTERPGSSDYVAGGVVAYANEAKAGLLGVDPDLIERHGAVSEQVAAAMAEGALRRFEADTAVAVTGIAGPGGGTAEKPVGTVCWCVLLREGTSLSRTLLLPGDRADIRERSTTVAMHLLRRLLSGEPTTGSHERAARAHVRRARPSGRARETHWSTWRDRLIAGRRDLRPVRPEALHVTLVFLGWQDEAAAERIAAAAFDAVGQPGPPLLTPAGVRPLPPRDPRLFALDLEDEDDRAVALQAAVSDALEAGRWYRPEKRPFWPHMTLARVKRGVRRAAAPA